MKNFNKIDLNEDGIILFLGTMNAMPMHYAMELRKLNQEVVYFVDVPISDVLSRPENHFKSISYPYPNWIVEFKILSQLLVSLFPSILFKIILNKIPKQYKNKKIKAIFLGGQYISLAALISNSNKIFLSYGADLEFFCNKDCLSMLTKEYYTKSFTKYLPNTMVNLILKRIINNNLNGALNSNYVLFFSKGNSKHGDKVVDELVSNGVQYLERYDDMYIDELSEMYNKKSVWGTNTLKIICATRFHFITSKDSNENKGNDIIIEGLAKYIKNKNQNVEIHFFEKGPDVKNAKKLCDELQISDKVIWHQEKSLHELLELYEEMHICFDQVGTNWIGAIGIYGIIMGIPTIVNAENYKDKLPVIQAKTFDEIYNGLIKLENEHYYKEISQKSKTYAKINLTPFKILKQIFLND